MTPQRSKEVGIIVFVVLYSAALFGLTSLFVYQGRATMIPVMILLGVLLVVWAACMAIALAVVQQPGSSAWLIFGTAIILASAGLVQLPALAAALLLAVFLGLARRSMYREVNNRVLYRASEVFRVGLRSILFGTGIAALGLAWPLVEDRLIGTQLILSPEAVRIVVQRIVPALPPHLTTLIDIAQLTSLVTASINQTLQSLIVSYHWIFLIIVLLIAISAWRAAGPLLVWVVLPILSSLIYLARKANFIYISRSQATIERLHL